jgi:hypothetical protein
LAQEGAKVLYVDTEAEGSTTMVALVEDEDTEFEKGDVENIEYERVNEFSEYMEYLHPDNGYQDEYDLIVVDTLDHKHTYAIKEVVGDVKIDEVDFNQWNPIYDKQKKMMEVINDPRTNILATIDPDSGKMDKPKGTQTNVHGYFNIVIDLMYNSGEYKNKIRNWVNKGEHRGKAVPELEEKLTEEFRSRIEFDQE